MTSDRDPTSSLQPVTSRLAPAALSVILSVPLQGAIKASSGPALADPSIELTLIYCLSHLYSSGLMWYSQTITYSLFGKEVLVDYIVVYVSVARTDLCGWLLCRGHHSIVEAAQAPLLLDPMCCFVNLFPIICLEPYV